MKKGKKKASALELLVAMGIAAVGFGSVLGLESNLRPLTNDRIKDTSFRAYLEAGKIANGKGVMTYIISAWTYPGARVGAAIHNYGLPEE